MEPNTTTLRSGSTSTGFWTWVRFGWVLLAGSLLACGGGGGGGPTGTEGPPIEEPTEALVDAKISADGDAVDGVRVRLHRSGSTDALTSRTTDASGEAVFSGLQPGPYDVRIDLPSNLGLPAAESTQKSVTATPGQTSSVSFHLAMLGPVEFGQVSDIDGHAYRTVRIENQRWMADNLRVSRFRNGDPVPEARTDDQWKAARKAESPAWSNFENDPTHAEDYGKLYNNFAAMDSRGLCPAGWHIPSDTEWKALERFVGISTEELDNNASFRGDVADKLKSTREDPDPHPRWNRPNRGMNNRTGFSSLPNGFRIGRPIVDDQVEGAFERLGMEATAWTSTAAGDGAHTARGMAAEFEGVYRNNASGFGFGVRCLED